MTLTRMGSGKSKSNPFLTAKDVKKAKGKFIIVTEPRIANTKFGEKMVCDVESGNEAFAWFLNNTSANYLIEQLGTDEKKWINEKVKLTVVRQATPKGMSDVIYVEGSI